MPYPNDGGPIRPGPPRYPPKVAKPVSQPSQFASAVLAMVDSTTNPTVATVYIDNTLPPEDGYKIPSNIGVKFQQAPNPFANPPIGIAYFNNTTTLDGGSWVTVDTVNKVIVHVDKGVSNAAPTNPSDLFQYIRHDGAFNTTGNFQNPGPIDQGQLSTVTGGTVSVAGISLGAYVISGTSVGVPVTFTPTFTGFTTSQIKQLVVVCVPHGLAASSSSLYNTTGWPWGYGVLKNASVPLSGNSCTVNVGGMATGFAYDLYAYVVGWDDLPIYPSNPIATTTAQTFSNVAKPKMPAGATVSASAISETLAEGGFKGYLTIGYNPSVIINFTLGDSNVPDTTVWGHQLIGLVRQTSSLSLTDESTYAQIQTGQITPGNGSANYIRFNGLTPNQSFDFAFTVMDDQGNQTPVVSLVTDYTVPQVSSGTPVGPVWGRGHFLGDLTEDISSSIVDTYGFVHGIMSGAVQGTLGPSPDPFGSYTLPGALHRLNLDDPGTPGGTNLVYNPTGAAAFNGWTRFGNGSAPLTYSTDGFGGGRFFGQGTLPAGIYDGWEQQVTVFTSQSVVVSGIIEGATIPAGITAKIDVVNSAQTAILGSVSWVSTGATRQPLAIAFNTGANTSVWVRFYIISSSGSSQTVYALFYKLQFEYGAQPSPFVDHLATGNHNKVFDGSANILASSTFNSRLPNVTAWQTNIVLNYSSSGTSPNITMKFWYDNGAGADATIYNPDGTTINVGHTTSASPSFTLTSVTTGAAIYILLYYTVGSSMTMSVTKTAPSQATVNQAYADGGFVAINATTTATSITGGGTGSKTGGGGHNFL